MSRETTTPYNDGVLAGSVSGCSAIPPQYAGARFWMVAGQNAGPARVAHTSYKSAHDEAARLATLNPGVRFYVLEARGYHVVEKPTTWHSLRP